MSPLLITSVIAYTIAMVFYTVSVWSERKARRLKAWHVRLFLFGVIADIIATGFAIKAVGGLVFTPHAIVGFISLGLMIIHYIWAALTLRGGREKSLINFHKLSLFVWSVWMISYLSGFALGMMKLG